MPSTLQLSQCGFSLESVALHDGQYTTGLLGSLSPGNLRSFISLNSGRGLSCANFFFYY
jgi:hypothetical protein